MPSSKNKDKFKDGKLNPELEWKVYRKWLDKEIAEGRMTLHKDDTEEKLRKEIELVREDAQIEILRRDKINDEHQKLNGQLREEIEDTKKEADKLMMNKIIKYENQLNEVKADNKKLAETVDRITHTPDNLRKKAVF